MFTEHHSIINLNLQTFVTAALKGSYMWNIAGINNVLPTPPDDSCDFKLVTTQHDT